MTCDGVSPFGHPGITVRLSTPPGLSQIPTSFIGSRCQGIHRTPLKTSHPHTGTIQTRLSRNTPPTPAHTPHNAGHTGAGGQRYSKKKLHTTGTPHPHQTAGAHTGRPDARVHYTVLKQQPPRSPPHPTTGARTGPRGTDPGLLPQDPTARQHNTPDRAEQPRAPGPAPTPRPPIQHPHPNESGTRGAYTGNRAQKARPSDTTFHPRAPAAPRTGTKRALTCPRQQHGTQAAPPRGGAP